MLWRIALSPACCHPTAVTRLLSPACCHPQSAACKSITLTHPLGIRYPLLPSLTRCSGSSAASPCSMICMLRTSQSNLRAMQHAHGRRSRHSCWCRSIDQPHSWSGSLSYRVKNLARCHAIVDCMSTFCVKFIVANSPLKVRRGYRKACENVSSQKVYRCIGYVRRKTHPWPQPSQRHPHTCTSTD